ncbi:endo-alpha-N-acetylgalactosaminidase family protein [Snuella lapsa]|uniref:Endo-alpha-N-acetylgalactosaminidase domain-containing protein n=1 Tax=Snuella lapsa TaxID=870481 RepID=A0ABP6Y1S2_9FLAO
MCAIIHSRLVTKIRLILAFGLISASNTHAQNRDTLYFDASGNQQHIKWQHRYDQTLTLKLFMSQADYEGKQKRKDNGKTKVYVNFEQALDIIKKIDNLTLGMPKIIYLVGWQYNGHDSKYPAFFEGNKALKRPQDKNALESLKWLMEAAKKYHTTVSIHINMFDAYEDSPLWDTYVKNNIIARHTNGNLRRGEWGYPISYAQEWKTGFAQKRIDSLCALLPITEAGTIHIDAFHTWPPIGEEGPGKRPFLKAPTSPFLNFSIQDETQAQKSIYKYWASKGIDVTSEGATFLRQDAFEGYQPMVWWVDWGLKEYMKWPASFYTGGEDRSINGKLFGSSMHGEDIIMKDPENLSGFKAQFCTSAIIWYYLNRLERQKYVANDTAKKVFFSNNVVTAVAGSEYTITKNNRILVENENVFIPALWIDNTTIIAYSKTGYKNKTWQLPKDWHHVTQVTIEEISLSGQKTINNHKTPNGQLNLSLAPDQILLITPKR